MSRRQLPRLRGISVSRAVRGDGQGTSRRADWTLALSNLGMKTSLPFLVSTLICILCSHDSSFEKKVGRFFVMLIMVSTDSFGFLSVLVAFFSISCSLSDLSCYGRIVVSYASHISYGFSNWTSQLHFLLLVFSMVFCAFVSLSSFVVLILKLGITLNEF